MARRNPRLKKANTLIDYTHEQVQELLKCSRDPVYFARKYVKIKHPKRGQIPFNLYDYQEELMRSYLNERYNIVLSARQTGKTETSCAFILWFAIFHDTKNILIVSNKSANAMEMISKIQNAYEELPDWLKPGILDTSWNKHECAFDNKSRIMATTTAPDSGRGFAISLLYCDEFAFVRPHIQAEFWDSVLPTLSTGGNCIISSTPNGDTNLFAQLWRGAEHGTNEFHHTFIPWDAAPGRDQKFKETQIGLLGERKWRQEYECEFLSSDATLIDTYIISQMEKKVHDTKPAFMIQDQPFLKPIDRTCSYIIGVDPATGSGEDYTVIEVFEFPSMIQVMEYRNNTMSPAKIYERLKNVIKFIMSFGATVYFSIENNGVGQGMISLYEVDEDQPGATFISEDKKLGLTTTAPSKMRSCIKLKELFERGVLTVYSKILLRELKNYVRKSGSYAAQIGATDDCIAAVLIIMRMLEEIATYDEKAYNMMFTFTPEGENWVPNMEDEYSIPMPMGFG